MDRRIVVIGAGPRGLSVLERLCDRLWATTENVVVHVVDPNPPGPGVHLPDQPGFLLMNTVAGQVSMFRSGDPVAGSFAVSGPSLAEWAGVDRDAYLPRAVMGQYLTYVYQRLRHHMPPHVKVRERRATAEGLRLRDNGSVVVDLTDGSICADFVFMATGHGSNAPTSDDQLLSRFADRHAAANPRLRYIRNCYPLRQLDTIEPETRVAVRGMGLSAVDAVATLTTGRGGGFVEQKDNDLLYLPSGLEPRIMVFSRSCRPFWPRAVNQKSPADTYRPRFLTRSLIAALRETHVQLDFVGHVLPAMIAELRNAAGFADIGDVESVLTGSAARVRRADTLEQYESTLLEFLAADERRAIAGNQVDPVKTATDALRDIRDELRAVVEHRGLTPTSHEQFVRVHAPAMSLVAAGPPLLRSREWRALFRSGTLRLGAGPAARIELDPDRSAFLLAGHQSSEASSCDVIVGAAVDTFHPEADTSPLVRSVLAEGLARPFQNGTFSPGGFDIDTAGRLIDVNGSVVRNVCALGNLTEGPRYFTNILPAPDVPSRMTADANAAVDAMLERLNSAPRLRQEVYA